MLSSPARATSWVFGSICLVALIGLAIAGTIILSLISVYLPNKGAGLIVNRCTLSFAPMISQPSGAGPSYIDDNDFNNDNIPDPLVVNHNDGTISIYRGIGNGTFNTQMTYSTGGTSSAPNAAFIGDINKDGNADIVVANSGASSVIVFIGKGDGTFSSQTIYSTGTNSVPLGLQLGDLNSDGILDAAVGDNANNLVLIFIGASNGVLRLTRSLSTGSGSGVYAVVIGDFNGDSRPDIAVTNNHANNAGIFLNNGGATFATQKTYSTGNGPISLIAVDLNKDNILDIATANTFGNSVSVLLGKGDGSFQDQKVLSTGSGSLPYSIFYGDFNRDNKQDIVVANSGTNNIGIFLGKGRGYFQNQQTFSTGAGSNPNGITVADYNKDNRLDVLSANYNNNTAGIFLSTCS